MVRPYRPSRPSFGPTYLYLFTQIRSVKQRFFARHGLKCPEVCSCASSMLCWRFFTKTSSRWYDAQEGWLGPWLFVALRWAARETLIRWDLLVIGLLPNGRDPEAHGSRRELAEV